MLMGMMLFDNLSLASSAIRNGLGMNELNSVFDE